MKKVVSNEQTFTQGAAILLVSTILVKLIGAFFKIPLSQDYCLGDLGFGYFSFSYDIYIPIYTLASSGFPVAISKIMSDYFACGKVEEAENAFRLYKNIMLVLGIVGCIFIVLLSFSGLLPNDGSMGSGYTLFAMSPAVVFCCLASVYRGAYESKRNMTPTAVSNVIEAIAKVFLGFGAALLVVKLTDNLAFGAAAAMAGISLGTLISYIYLNFSYSANHKQVFKKKSIRQNTDLFKKLVIISLPIVFCALSVSVISLIDALTVNYRLSAMIKNNFNEIVRSFDFAKNLTAETLPAFLYGLRSKAYTLFHLVPTFASALAVSALPTLTAAFTSGKSQDYNDNSVSLIKFTSVITFPLGIGMIFVGRPVMALLYGENTANAGGVLLAIYGFAAVAAGITIATTTLLQSVGKQNVAFVSFAFGLVLKLLLNIVLVGLPEVNIYGAALSTAICYVFVFVTNVLILFKSKLLSNIKNTFLKPFLSSVCCGTTAYLITMISDSKAVTLIAISAAAVVYLVALLLLKTFNAFDIEGLPFSKKLLKFLKIK